MSKITTMIASPDDAALVMRNLRYEDRREVELATGIRAESHDVMSYGPYIFCAALDGEPIAIFGITGFGDTGFPWLLCTDAVSDCGLAFAREARRWFGIWSNHYSELRNFTHVESTAAHRLLRWLGFEFEEPVQFGPMRAEFYPFSWRRS